MTSVPPGAFDATGLTEALDGAAPHAQVGRFRLTVLEGPDAGKSFTSSGERTVVGTHQLARFVLGERSVSRFHCELVVAAGGVLVRDLGSRNGTQVDGVLVHAAPLRRSARLQLGRSELSFELLGDAARVPLSERAC